jgi:UDP-GlcNAc:undecaprenyl-phosphate/decaprenyl-phosphate GlcNAc-1-phosphate transferase
MDRAVWILTILLVTGAVGFTATFATRATARAIGFVARPRAERWHRRPTALAGGIGFFIPFALALAYFQAWRLLAGASAMFLLGLVDDLVQLKPYTKLSTQLLIAGLTVALGPALLWTPFPIVNQAISLFWIIGITNAINLLDNMDGLSAGVATVVAIFVCIFSLQQGQLALAGTSAALAGALLGFLVFNWNPASIFMGDCGSLFLGYSLSVLALQQNYGRSRSILVVIAAPVMVMLVPIFDTTFVTLTRILRGRPVSQGGRDHTSHRLVTLGLSEPIAVGTLMAVGALGGGIALSARVGFRPGVWIGAPLLVIALAFVAIHLARTDSPEPSAGSVGLLGWLRAFGYKRRIFEVLLDLVLAMVALVSAFLLRFDGEIPDSTALDLARVFPIIIAAKVVLLFVAGAYDGVWRYAGLPDLVRLVRGAIYGSAAAFVIAVIWVRLGTLSRGALLIDAVVFASLLAASRIGFRVLGVALRGNVNAKGSTRLLVWGAGDMGAALVRKLLDAPEEGLVPVGFIDDDPSKLGRKIHGIPVLGSSHEIEQLLRSGLAERVLLASVAIGAERIGTVAMHVGKERLGRLRLVLEDIPRLPAAAGDA